MRKGEYEDKKNNKRRGIPPGNIPPAVLIVTNSVPLVSRILSPIEIYFPGTDIGSKNLKLSVCSSRTFLN